VYSMQRNTNKHHQLTKMKMTQQQSLFIFDHHLSSLCRILLPSTTFVGSRGFTLLLLNIISFQHSALAQQHQKFKIFPAFLQHVETTQQERQTNTRPRNPTIPLP
jgi:hypothetical protein